MKALLLRVLSKEKGDLSELISVLKRVYGNENVKVNIANDGKWYVAHIDIILERK